MTIKSDVTPGSGNVFADIGLPDPAGELFKAELTYQISKRIKALGLMQNAAAVRLGLSQPDVSRLMKGRRAGFSTDRLLALLTALDLDVEIVVRSVDASKGPARVRALDMSQAPDASPARRG